MRQSLSVDHFHQVRSLLQQTGVAVQAIVFSETDVLEDILKDVLWLVVISERFSALLLGTPQIASKSIEIDLTFDSTPIAKFIDRLLQVLPPDLPIATKIHQSRSIFLQPNDAQIQTEFTLQLIATLSHSTSNSTDNSQKRSESDATIELICDSSPLTEAAIHDVAPNVASSVASSVAPDVAPDVACLEGDLAAIANLELRQQIEREQFLNQVTRQIRQSLELPIILQTAVAEVQKSLQVDRLLIYQFAPRCILSIHTADSSTTPQAAVDSLKIKQAQINQTQINQTQINQTQINQTQINQTKPNHTKPKQAKTYRTKTSQAKVDRVKPESLEDGRYGFISYEARSSEAIPSVLNWMDQCHLANEPINLDQYRSDLAIATPDIQTDYAQTPCLLNLLTKAKVRSKLAAPIWIQDDLWGFLVAHQCDRPRQWQPGEQRFFQQIAEHLAIAIQQAQLYTQLQQQAQTLEQRVNERTQELRDVMQTAQIANRSKSEFLAAVSHELRTPLTCIIGMSETLKRWSQDVLSDRQQNFLQAIHDSGEQLLTLINDILDVSQAEAGKVVLDPSEFSLSLVAHQALKAFEVAATAQRIYLELDLRVESGGDRFVADVRRVQQILFNLLDNAIKFTHANGRVRLRVALEDNMAILAVSDTGIGIATEHLPNLFQKFQQLDAGYRRQYRGTGLGLALTKQLVDLHGGWIDVESTVDIGSIFTVHLPMQSLADEESRRRIRTAAITEQPKGRIVLIEPEEESANVICDVLTSAGFQLVWLLEGSTAVDQIEILRPLAVITNIQLPDIDGHQMIQRLRQNPLTKHLKIIALTHQTQQPAKLDSARSIDPIATNFGADSYLPQPARPDHLLQKLLELTVNR